MLTDFSDGRSCQEGILYTDVTASSQWPAMTVPILLLCFGFRTYQKRLFLCSFFLLKADIHYLSLMFTVAIIQLTFLLFTFLFVRHIFLSCCSDPESQSQNVRSQKQNPRRVKSLIWFERIMTFCGIAYSVVAVILAIWVSQTNAEGDVGYKL